MKPLTRTILLAVLLLAVLLPSQARTQSPFLVYMPLIAREFDPNNLDVSTATYLGGLNADNATAVEIASDQTIVVGGSLPGYIPNGATEITIQGGTSGAVVRLAPDGRSAQTITRIGASVTDLELAGDGRIAVCGDFGVATLLFDGTARIWGNASFGSISRCAIGSDGITAVLSSATVAVFTDAGAQIGSWSVPDTPRDLAVDSSRGQVIVIGWKQVTSELKIPFIRSYAFNGAPGWTSYDFPSGTSNLGSADTRGERITLGRDGRLYAAFSIDGGTGASVLTRDPHDTSISAAGRTVVTDAYTDPYNVGSATIAWFGRFDPSDGDLELGQSLLTRTGDGSGNSITIRAISADSYGRVALAGDTACCIKNRDIRKVAGAPVGTYEQGESYALTLSADFRIRGVWTVFTAPGTTAGGSPGLGIALRNGTVALVGTLNQNDTGTRRLITYQAIQSYPGSTTASDGYLAVWPWPQIGWWTVAGGR